jgi:hypothetical protein
MDGWNQEIIISHLLMLSQPGHSYLLIVLRQKQVAQHGRRQCRLYSREIRVTHITVREGNAPPIAYFADDEALAIA